MAISDSRSVKLLATLAICDSIAELENSGFDGSNISPKSEKSHWPSVTCVYSSFGCMKICKFPCVIERHDGVGKKSIFRVVARNWHENRYSERVSLVMSKRRPFERELFDWNCWSILLPQSA